MVALSVTDYTYGQGGADVSLRRSNRASAIKGRSEFAIFQVLPFMDWLAQPPQPPRPVPSQQRAAAIMPRDDGTQATLINWLVDGWAIQPPQPPHLFIEKRFASIARGDDGSEATKINFFPFGYDPLQPQPNHPRPERFAAVYINEDGIEFPFKTGPLTSAFIWGWEVQSVQPPFFPKIFDRSAGIKGKSEFAIFSPFVIYGWEASLHQPQHPRPEKWAALIRGDDGNQAVPVIIALNWGFDASLPNPVAAFPTIHQRASGAAGESSFAAFLLLPWWEAPDASDRYPTWMRSGAGIAGQTDPPFVPAGPTAALLWGHDRESFVTRKYFRGGGIAARDDGNEAVQINFFPFGYDPLQPQPNHPRPERWGSIAAGDQGNEAPFVFIAQVIPWWQADSFQPIHTRFERWGSIARGDDGTQAPMINWLGLGWPFDPFQTEHIRRERWAAIARGDDGNQAQFSVFQQIGWPFDPFQPRHPRIERAASWMIGDDGTQATFVSPPPPLGWPLEFFQPKHPRPERSAAWMRGGDGIEQVLLRWLNAGWQVQDVQPNHPRPERFGSLVFGEPGTEAPFIPPSVIPSSWGHAFGDAVLIRQFWKSGGVLVGDGYYFFTPEIIPPPPPPPPPPVRPYFKPSPFAPPTIYPIDTLVQMNVTFYDVARQLPADPFEVLLFVQDPSGNVVQLPSPLYPNSPIVKQGIGKYYCDFLPYAPGRWKYKWRGLINGVVATSKDTAFIVVGSNLDLN